MHVLTGLRCQCLHHLHRTRGPDIPAIKRLGLHLRSGGDLVLEPGRAELVYYLRLPDDFQATYLQVLATMVRIVRSVGR